MDEISRGSASDDPGQRIVEKRTRKGGRKHDIVGVSDRGTSQGDSSEPASSERGIVELAEELMGNDRLGEECESRNEEASEIAGREELLMADPPKKARKKTKARKPRTKAVEHPVDPAESADSAEPDEIPIEDAPGAVLPEELEQELASDTGGEDEPAAPENLGRVLCALLLSSREGLSMLRMAQSTNSTPKEVKAALEVLRETLDSSGLPLELNIAGEEVRLLTTPDVFDYLRSLRSVKKREKLSAAALETLAVIAYRQPVMRAEIEAIRGVKAGPILRTLLDHRMVKITGRADVPGRPLQYGTTQHFLETFGLESLNDLPSVKEFRSL